MTPTPSTKTLEKARQIIEAGTIQTISHDTDGNGATYRIPSQTDPDTTYTVAIIGDTLADATCTCPAQHSRTTCAYTVAALQWHNEPETVEEEGGVIIAEPSPAPTLAHTPGAGDLGAMILSPHAELRGRAYTVLGMICGTEMVPKAYRGKPDAAMAAVLLGHDWGLGPLESLQYIDVIQGSVEPNAELKLRLYRRAGHSISGSEWAADGSSVTITGRRGDTGEEMTVTYSLDDAKRQGLLSKDNWKRDPESMLWARCASRLVRRLAPDAMDRRP